MYGFPSGTCFRDGLLHRTAATEGRAGRRGGLALLVGVMVLCLACVSDGFGDYYYHHVWMSDTDNPTYPKPGALSSALWESFSYWDDWAGCTPTLQTDPTADQVLGELASYRATVGAGDVFVLYYTGHGEPTEIDSVWGRGWALSLRTSGSAGGSGVTTDALAGPDYLGGFCEGATVIAIFDTCYAGQALGGPYGMDASDSWVDGLDNAAVLAATGPEEQIGLYPQNYRPWPPGSWDYVSSYFTQGVIEGLQPTAEGWAAADLSQDGRLYAGELFGFASERIRGVGGSGGVYWNDIGSDELPLAEASPTPEPGSLLLFVAGSAGLVALRRVRRR